MKKLTLKEINKKLKGISPSIEILSDKYINSKSKLKFRCLECKHEWNRTWEGAQANKGCPICVKERQSEKARLGINIVRDKLKEINENTVIISNEYKNNTTPLLCKCNICRYKWNTTWGSLRSGNGCPSCANVAKMTLNTAKERLKLISPNIEIVDGFYKNSSTKINCKCTICGHTWGATWAHLSSGRGCLICSGKAHLNLGEVKNRLKKISPNIKITSKQYINSQEKLQCKCDNCGNQWGSPWTRLSQGVGCAICSKSNNGWSRSKWVKQANKSRKFNSFKLYIIKCFNDYESFYKIGITFLKVSERFKGNDLPYSYEIIKIVESNSGEYIYDLENKLQKEHRFKNLIYKPSIKFGGSERECFSELLEINKIIKDFKNERIGGI